jgi:hypothetical protein
MLVPLDRILGGRSKNSDMATHRRRSRLPEVQVLTPEEAKALFDRRARYYLHMSGEEFLRAWDAGEFDDDPDRPEVIRVVMLLPFAR